LSETHIQRRLVAILAADVVGYSRLMEQDEAGTLTVLKARRRDIFLPLVSKNHGRVVKWMGDGALVEFQSAIDAVNCALRVVEEFASANLNTAPGQQILLRIGINVGDVILEGSDLYGEGVNVAVRLQTLADPNGICVSHFVHDQVRKKVVAHFEELGPQTVKNLSEPVIAWKVTIAETGAPRGPETGAMSSKPSIAVLPFTTMAHDQDQETFADGLTEDLITDLSRTDAILVTARHSCFAYKGKSIDVRRIAGELGVRYVLEGSARRQSKQMRINVQLIDATTGNHIWAERYDRSLDDVFSVQDEVTARIVEALAGRLIERKPRNRPKSMEA
jgi:TolB-like protein